MAHCEEYSKIQDMIIRANKDGIETPFLVIDNMIMATNEKAANVLADFLDYFNYQACTGYYDPDEDTRNGEVNEVTGLWYIDI